MAELSLREQLYELKIDTTQVLRENTDACYLTEHDVAQILALIRTEIEKQMLTDAQVNIILLRKINKLVEEDELNASRNFAHQRDAFIRDAQREADLKCLE